MKILIIDDMHISIVSLLEEQGHIVHYVPTITKEQIFAVISDYQGIIVRSKIKLDKSFFQEASNLKFIGRAGAGLDQIDLHEVEKRKIQVLNAPEGNREALSEHALAMLLSLLNNLKKADKEIEQKVWDREGNRGYELGNRTIGIIGYGYMGQAFAKLAKSFGCQILAYDKYKKNYSDEYVQEATLSQIFDTCDVLSLHVPLTDETNDWVNAAFFEQFKKPFWLINTARGQILVLKDLIKSLENGKILGAGLDVLENEKFNTLTTEQKEILTKLSHFSNVILTPHVGGWTYESYQKISFVLAEKIKGITV